MSRPGACALKHPFCGAALVGLLVLVLLAPTAARAHGDPASDVLLTRRVFYAYDASISSAAAGRLEAVVAEAVKAGYPIRVALIAKPHDLGDVPTLFNRPRRYAQLLDPELGLVRKDPLLVVMPAGLGYVHAGRSSAATYKALGRVRVGTGNDALPKAAVEAIGILAADAGHPIAIPKPVSETNPDTWRTRLLVLVVVGGVSYLLLFAGLGARVFVRRRRTAE